MMTRFHAHAMFCLRADGGHSLLPSDCDLETAPAFATALASLSGRLDTCETDDDLDEAVRHGFRLIREGVYDEKDIDAEVKAVFDDVGRWGRKAESELN